jgi:hypothetical protein
MPTNIATNDIHSAEMTLSATAANTALSGSRNVTFNKGTDDAVDIDVINNFNTSGLVLEPIRPCVYIAQGEIIPTRLFMAY